MRATPNWLGLVGATVLAILAGVVLLVTWAAGRTGHFADGQLAIPLAALKAPVTTLHLADYGAQAPFTDTVHIVLLPEGRLLAFSGRDLFGEHCSAPWLAAEEAFHEVCRGTVFTVEGKIVAGPGPLGLGRLPLQVVAKSVIVDLRQPPVPTEDRRALAH